MVGWERIPAMCDLGGSVSRREALVRGSNGYFGRPRGLRFTVPAGTAIRSLEPGQFSAAAGAASAQSLPGGLRDPRTWARCPAVPAATVQASPRHSDGAPSTDFSTGLRHAGAEPPRGLRCSHPVKYPTRAGPLPATATVCRSSQTTRDTSAVTNHTSLSTAPPPISARPRRIRSEVPGRPPSPRPHALRDTPSRCDPGRHPDQQPTRHQKADVRPLPPSPWPEPLRTCSHP